MSCDEGFTKPGPAARPTALNVVVQNLPQVVDEQFLISYLEAKLGKGCVTRCKISRYQDTAISKGMGSIHIIDRELAEAAVRLAEDGVLEIHNRKLRMKHGSHGGSNRSQQDNRLVLHGSELHIGCLKAADKMVTLYSLQSSVELGIDYGMESFSVQITSQESAKQYKLEFHGARDLQPVLLSNIQFQGQVSRGLLFQIQDSPPHLFSRRIEPDVKGDLYSEMLKPSIRGSEETVSEWTSLAWIRTVDFTEENVIGQSFAYMLRLKEQDGRLEDWLSKLKVFDSIQVDKSYFWLERGEPFAIFQEVVPILRSKRLQDSSVPFDIVFRINHLVQHDKLNAATFDNECADLAVSRPEGIVRNALSIISQLAPHHSSRDSRHLLISKLEEAQALFHSEPSLPATAKGQMWIYRLLITPTKCYCMGPEVEPSNRVTRLYEQHAENFLRVNFVEEDLCPLSSSALVSAINTTNTAIYRRVLKILRNGLWIGNKHFEFLAFSSSQLRDGQLWMFADVVLENGVRITASSIRDRMGDFSQIRNVAKCAARMGQCFSSSRRTLTVLPMQLKVIRDIYVITDHVKYCFSDGIGKISMDFARKVAATCGFPSGKTPSAFQIRYAGYKGVVAVDPLASNSFKLYLRPSMRKFDSPHVNLEVLEWTRVLPSYLNRQAISLLSTLGVGDSVFIDMQNHMVNKWCRAISDVSVAKELLMETDAKSTAFNLLNSGFTVEKEPFLQRLMVTHMYAELNDIRTRARIFVKDGRQLMGCLDETGILEYGQAFVNVSSGPGKDSSPNSSRVIQQKVIVLKNPCLHPGDVRVLQCIDVPGLHHMVDCIVFPQRGPRPHPNECSGSDLDGDMYFVSWNQSLIPPTVDPPMNYEAAPQVELYRPVTMKDIQKFFVDYMVNDNLGVISNAHVVHCDMESNKARSLKCLELAHLASVAVDFPKTGVPAVIPWYLRPREYPDFMEKDYKASYISNGVLGKLYRCSKSFPHLDTTSNIPKLNDSNGVATSTNYCDPDLVISGHAQFVETALKLKGRYDGKLIQIMNHYGIKEEAEVFGGHIISLSRFYKRKQMDVAAKIEIEFDRLRQEVKSWFNDFKEWGNTSDVKLALASAWYVCTYHSHYYGKRDLQLSTVGSRRVYLQSFPWVLSDILCRMKKHASCEAQSNALHVNLVSIDFPSSHTGPEHCTDDW